MKNQVNVCINVPDGFKVKRIDHTAYKGEYVYCKKEEFPFFVKIDKIETSNDHVLLILEPIKWRAKLGEEYQTVSVFGEVETRTESNVVIDNKLWEKGNYFNPKEKRANHVSSCFKRLLDHNTVGNENEKV